jgi:hypothetical protein
LDEAEQRCCKANPFNVQRGFANGQLIITSRLVAVELGGNQFVGAGFKLIVDDEPLLQLDAGDEGRLQVSADLYDRTDTRLVTIVDNEWVTGDPLPWDLQYRYRWICLRMKAKDVVLDIDAREPLVRVRGTFWRRGQCFSVTESAVMANGVVRNSGLVDLCLVGMLVRIDTRLRKLVIASDSALRPGMIVSWPDPAQRLKRGFSAYEQWIVSKGLSA